MERGNKEEVELNEMEESKNKKRKTKVKNERTLRGTTINLTLQGCICFLYLPVFRNDTEICIHLSLHGQCIVIYLRNKNQTDTLSF